MSYPSDADVPVDTTIDPDIVPPKPRIDHSVGFSDGSDQPEEPEDRTIVGELVEVEQEEAPPQRLTLTNEERQDFARLVTVGRRRKEIIVAKHRVTIQTLQSIDEMRIGLYTKPYLDSQGFARAYHVGVCAAGIAEIKNQPLWESLAPIEDPDERFAKNVEVLSTFYPVVISRIYQAIMDLEREFAQLAIKLGYLGDPAKK